MGEVEAVERKGGEERKGEEEKRKMWEKKENGAREGYAN
jgi:hypothetical protein